MELPKTYSPQAAEAKWYAYWLENKFFASQPSPTKEPYTVVIPPPNVTGVLHMGHMLNNTLQDVLVRRARMQGKEACWVPGTDHASIATEAKVVAMLAAQGISKKDLSREEFLKYAWEWKEKYGGIILQQLKKLGCSCDWDRTRFTMEPEMSAAVIEVFVDLFNKGLIYRGVRMVNWDPQGRTALSDEEVIYKESQSRMYYVKYPVEGRPGEFITIATVRPETIPGDTAVCVHPDDERYRHLHGQRVIVPLVNRPVPLITDTYIDPTFGTGALKVTPAHDINDYNLGVKHNLPVIDTISDDGTMSEAVGLPQYVGKDRFAVRREIVQELEGAGLLVKVEEYKNQVGTSERTGAVIEPKLSLQWFLKMEEMAGPALAAVMDDEIQLHPPKFKNMYRSWMENVHDWCISRQLWWGHRIPAYYLPDGTFVVAETPEKALALAQAKIPSVKLEELRQDDDVLDTWFSAWLWPISVFDGFANPDNVDIKYYYPTNDLVTAPEILFFWVARMIMAGLEYRKEVPFRNVYLTGIVRDEQGRKMSKQLGNSPDPLELIAEYGADAVRVGMLFSSPAGNDLRFPMTRDGAGNIVGYPLIEQGRNFANKIWNAFRLVKGWEVADQAPAEKDTVAIRWFEARFQAAFAEIEEHFANYRISDALLALYKLIWDDFCSWYLEMVKPPYQQPISQTTYGTTTVFFEDLLKLLHPFMPFVTEELWQHLAERQPGESLCVTSYPVPQAFESAILAEAEAVFEAVTALRNLRAGKGISFKVALPVQLRTSRPEVYQTFRPVIQHLANVPEISFVAEQPAGALPLVVGGDELFVTLNGQVDTTKEREKVQKELDNVRSYLQTLTSKLSNERFVQNAPEQVLAGERQKQAEAEARLRALEESLRNLN